MASAKVSIVTSGTASDQAALALAAPTAAAPVCTGSPEDASTPASEQAAGAKLSVSASSETSDQEQQSPKAGARPAVVLPPGHIEEKFRVDRRKLEHMIVSEERYGELASQFFLRISDMTATIIEWPTKLKIGAKSKKDPHVKVRGNPERVERAKQLVLSILDNKSNRVTLKMDVAHTEHSHVIGKGGSNIKSVMQDTGCHIHFPDSNAMGDRRAHLEKSNQVTVSGQPGAVETARVQIRQLLPISVFFDLVPPQNLTALQGSPFLHNCASSNRVQLLFSFVTRQPFAVASLPPFIRCEVRGTQSNKDGIIKVVNEVLNVASVPMHRPSVFCILDIAPQHHLFMMGRNSKNLLRVQTKTGATIIFPDSSLVSSQRRSQVTLSGPVEAVLKARQSLLDCLPLVLTFDIKDEERNAMLSEKINIQEVMERLDVFISIKPLHPKHRVIVKSIERNAQQVYTARRCLFNEDEFRRLKDSAEEPSDNEFSLDVHDWPPLAALSLDNLQNIPGRQAESAPSQAASISNLRRGSLPNVRYHSQRITGGRMQARAAPHLAASAAVLKASASSSHLSPIHAAGSEGTPINSPRLPHSVSQGSDLHIISTVSGPSPSKTAAEADRNDRPPAAETVHAASTLSGVSDGSSSSLSSGAGSGGAFLPSLAWLRPLMRAPMETVTCQLLSTLLQEIGINEKHAALLEAEEVDLIAFCGMTDADLKDVGIKNFGPRKKMVLAIEQLKTAAGNGSHSLKSGTPQLTIDVSDVSDSQSGELTGESDTSPTSLPNATRSILPGPDESMPRAAGLQVAPESTDDVVGRYGLSPGKNSPAW